MSAFMDGTEEGWEIYNEYNERFELQDRKYELEDIENEGVDINKISSGITKETKDKIITVKTIITSLEERLGKTIPIEDIMEEAEDKGLTEKDVEEIIQRLKRSGDIFEPRRGFINRI